MLGRLLVDNRLRRSSQNGQAEVPFLLGNDKIPSEAANSRTQW
jgi:hypothetical protein